MSTTRLVTSIIAKAFISMLVVMSQPALAQENAGIIDEDGYFEAIEKVTHGVWLIRQGKPFHVQPIGNVTVIEQDDGLILVDSGGSPGSGRRIAELVRSVSPKPVKTVIITHWHGDHLLGLPGIRETWPQSRVLMTEGTKRAALGASMARYAKGRADPGKTEEFVAGLGDVGTLFENQLKQPGHAPEVRAGVERTLRELRVYKRDVDGLFIVDDVQSFSGGITLKDKAAPVEIIQPGRANTDGDAVVWLPRQKILITGDLVVAPIPFGFGSYPGDWIAALEKLRGYKFKTLIPGHGTPQSDRVYIDRLIALIREVRSKVAPLARHGFSLDDTRKKLDFSSQRELFSGGDPWLARYFNGYWLAPFIESAWKEAQNIPIVQGVG